MSHEHSLSCVYEAGGGLFCKESGRQLVLPGARQTVTTTFGKIPVHGTFRFPGSTIDWVKTSPRQRGTLAGRGTLTGSTTFPEKASTVVERT